MNTHEATKAVNEMCRIALPLAVDWRQHGTAEEAFGSAVRPNADDIRELDDEILSDMLVFAQIGYCHTINVAMAREVRP